MLSRLAVYCQFSNAWSERQETDASSSKSEISLKVNNCNTLEFSLIQVIVVYAAALLFIYLVIYFQFIPFLAHSISQHSTK